MTAAEERFASLRLALGDGIGLVHGQMPPASRDAAMADFAAGRTRLLVATTVIEVGVDVPNATIMVIEGAQAFGLAQLHQLRGRVGRGAGKSTCVLLYDPPLGETARARLEILRETEDGFRIAEEDLKIRGAGDLIGVAQSGLPRFRIADLETQADLMRMAQDDSRFLLDQDPEPRVAARPGRAGAALADAARPGDPNALRGLAGRSSPVPLSFTTILDTPVKDVRTMKEQTGPEQEFAMLQDARRMIARNRATLLREAAGLAGVCVTIVVALYLPVLA